MKISPHLPTTVSTSRTAGGGVVSNRPQTPDPVPNQPGASRPSVVSPQERELAESILSDKQGATTRELLDRKARRALQAYASVANTQERDYVSRVLGFNGVA